MQNLGDYSLLCPYLGILYLHEGNKFKQFLKNYPFMDAFSFNDFRFETKHFERLIVEKNL